jgi:hypothetical protein
MKSARPSAVRMDALSGSFSFARVSTIAAW